MRAAAPLQTRPQDLHREDQLGRSRLVNSGLLWVSPPCGLGLGPSDKDGLSGVEGLRGRVEPNDVLHRCHVRAAH